MDHKQLVFIALDPMKGRGREVTRFSTSPTPDAEYAWDLSPDGRRIAILRRSETTIHVLSFGDLVHEVLQRLRDPKLEDKCYAAQYPNILQGLSRRLAYL